MIEYVNELRKKPRLKYVEKRKNQSIFNDPEAIALQDEFISEID